MTVSHVFTMRDELRYAAWASWAQFKHLFGVHTWVPNEVWDRSPTGIVIRFEGKVCWLCPERR